MQGCSVCVIVLRDMSKVSAGSETYIVPNISFFHSSLASTRPRGAKLHESVAAGDTSPRCHTDQQY